jgi:hypothetical protein
LLAAAGAQLAHAQRIAHGDADRRQIRAAREADAAHVQRAGGLLGEVAGLGVGVVAAHVRQHGVDARPGRQPQAHAAHDVVHRRHRPDQRAGGARLVRARGRAQHQDQRAREQHRS